VLFKLLLLFVLVPLIELWLLLWLADRTSSLSTFTLVVVTGVVGTWLARSQGWRTLRRIRLAMARGELPAEALWDAAMIFAGGLLLLTPGLLTDAWGVSLLVPRCRRRYRRWLQAWFRRQFPPAMVDADRGEKRTRIIDSYVVDPAPEGRSRREDDGR
jgi:UPF0716 protein FxsA